MFTNNNLKESINVTLHSVFLIITILQTLCHIAKYCSRKIIQNLNKSNSTTFIYINLLWYVLFWWHIKPCRLSNAKYIMYIWTVLFQTIQFNISTVLMSNTFIWPTDRTLSGATIRFLSVRALIGGILSLCRDAVGGFCSFNHCS